MNNLNFSSFTMTEKQLCICYHSLLILVKLKTSQIYYVVKSVGSENPNIHGYIEIYMKIVIKLANVNQYNKYTDRHNNNTWPTNLKSVQANIKKIRSKTKYTSNKIKLNTNITNNNKER